MISSLAAQAYERRIDKLQIENKELSRKLQGGYINTDSCSYFMFYNSMCFMHIIIALRIQLNLLIRLPVSRDYLLIKTNLNDSRHFIFHLLNKNSCLQK